MDTLEIAVVPGDGVGREVVAEAIKVLAAVSDLHGGVKFSFTEFPWGCEYYLRTGRMMEEGGLRALEDHRAILLGAVGAPGLVPDHVSLWGLLLPIRKTFDQYVNLRPIKLLRGIPSRLVGKGPEDIDFMVVRENTEGEYSGVGGRVHVGTPQEVAVQSAVFTRHGTERVMRYAFELARGRRRAGRVVSITKSNACNYSMVFWDEVFHQVAKDYPEIEATQVHVDAAAMYLITKPEWFDVVVATNLFGDILTDEGAAIQGSIGLAPGANLNPERKYPSMFEPIHGSAPDIAGQGIANPIGTIWAAAMMLDFLGYPDLGGEVVSAIEQVLLADGPRPVDLGGTATTSQVGDAVAEALRAG
ncbi:MAG: tartrate dehydrogenase [Firmicutes bacterium]|jgi:tartrate dehydrogenase/decarboxylase/D-malate dehydrogenase|nr:tartrate dehydrogenase [Bacillota bacterium]